MLKEFTPRIYQETILDTCTKGNTLVVLPTGMGKTAIALMLAVYRLKNYPTSKILFLAPTKPLVEQHLQTFKKHLQIDQEKLAVFTGLISPEKRAEQWKTAQIIFSTPQGLTNDVISGKISLEDISLCIFDEAHRATGEYDYCFIAKQYQKTAKYPKILAMTASPGDNLEKINEICTNLFIEDIEVKTENDLDVQQYIKEIAIIYEKIELPQEYVLIKNFLEKCYKEKLEEVKKYRHIGTTNINKTELLKIQSQLFSQINSGEKNFTILKSVSLIAEALKVQHALDLIETQGVKQLSNYLERLEADAETTKVKAIKNLVNDLHFRSALIKTRESLTAEVKNPKTEKIKELLKKELFENKKSKIIIFTQYRDSAIEIKKALDEEKILSQIFVGHTKKGETGLSQKKQIEMLDQFKDGLFNVLVATSVAEEGLDIPSVDMVMFYEPVPSAIRSIQRRGRTGRQDKGKVIMLVAKNTRDEGYKWSSHYKEKRMNNLLKDLKTKIGKLKQTKTQPILEKYYTSEKVKIFVDYREKSNPAMKELIEKNCEIKLETLECGDYVLSKRTGVEFKTKEDFVNSIVDGRLLEQIRKMREYFERPIIILEGEQDIYSIRKVHPHAIQGMIATITISYGIPIIHTKNSQETAQMLIAIAKREQLGEHNYYHPHSEKRTMTLQEQQEYLVSSLPNIGPELAKQLLKKFKTIKNLANSTKEELIETEGIGEKLAERIKELIEKEF